MVLVAAGGGVECERSVCGRARREFQSVFRRWGKDASRVLKMVRVCAAVAATGRLSAAAGAQCAGMRGS